MDNIAIRATIIIRFAYPTTHYNNNSAHHRVLDESSSGTTRRTAGNKTCAVCGSQLHMTSKVYNEEN
jgi:hypothetical protein